MPDSRLLRTLVSPYLLGERGKYDFETVEGMTDEAWINAVMLRLKEVFEVHESGDHGAFVVKLCPLKHTAESADPPPSYTGAGETIMVAIARAVLSVMQSADRGLLPHPQGISTAMRVVNM